MSGHRLPYFIMGHADDQPPISRRGCHGPCISTARLFLLDSVRGVALGDRTIELKTCPVCKSGHRYRLVFDVEDEPTTVMYNLVTAPRLPVDPPSIEREVVIAVSCPTSRRLFKLRVRIALPREARLGAVRAEFIEGD